MQTILFEKGEYFNEENLKVHTHICYRFLNWT